MSNYKILRLKALLKEKKLTYAKFAALIGKSEPTVRNWFKGTSKIDIDTIEKIAQVLGVPVSYFFGESGENGAIVSKQNVINGGNYTIIGKLEAQNEKLMEELLECQKKLQEAQEKIIRLLEERNKND